MGLADIARVGDFDRISRAGESGEPNSTAQYVAPIAGTLGSKVIGLYSWDPSGRIVEANDAFLDAVGYERADIGEGPLNLHAITPPENQGRSELTGAAEHARLIPCEREMIRKDGSRVTVFSGAVWHEAEFGPGACFVIDVSGRKSVERQLVESEERFRALVDGMKDHAVCTIDAEGFINSWNAAAERATGYPSQEAIGQPFSRFYTQEDRNARKPQSDLEVATNEGSYEQEAWRVRRDGTIFRADVAITALRDRDGVLRGFSNVMCDITERKRVQEDLVYLAHFDQLTGLVNRSLFRDRLNGAIARSEHDGFMVALLLVDLDRFKDVNDTLGHDAGDALLKEVAARLKGCVREIDTIARLGGDEFGLVLENVVSVPEVLNVARGILGTLNEPISVSGRELMVTTSIGVAVYPDSDADRIISDADVAMNAAKRAGRNNYQFYMPEMNVRALERTAIESGLERALERDAFVLHYQPQVEIATGRLIGAEALIRWKHPDLGLVYPERFVPLLEETGMIVPVGEWVLRAACRQSNTWRDAGLPVPRVSINVSARQLEHSTFVDSVAGVLHETGTDPALLGLEITESLFLEDTRAHGAVLARLKRLGLSISIDDFGTGYSSLSYLKRLPLDYLKMDRSFVGDIATDPDHDAIVAAIIGLAHNLRLRVIAEGVETEEQLSYLHEKGCDVAQGYFLHHPLTAEETTSLFENSGVSATA